MFMNLSPIKPSSTSIPAKGDRITIYTGDVYPEAGVDKNVLYLGGQMIKMRIDGTQIKFVSTKTDGTESTLAFAAPGANYVTSFRIIKVYYLTPNTAIILYDYANGANTRVGRTLKPISVRVGDGSLFEGQSTAASNAITSTETTDCYTIRGLYDDFIIVYETTTISTGVIARTGYGEYMQSHVNLYSVYGKDGGGTTYRVPVFTHSGTPGYSAIRHNICSKGGCFFKDAYGQPSIAYFYNHTDGYSNAKLSAFCPNFETYTTIDGISYGVQDHFMLGLTNSGQLLTAQFIYNSTSGFSDIVLYGWNFITIPYVTECMTPIFSSTPILDSLYATSLKSILKNDYEDLNVENYYILGFEDDILMVWDSVADIYYDISVRINANGEVAIGSLTTMTNAVTIKESKYYEMIPGAIGRGSIPFEGLFRG